MPISTTELTGDWARFLEGRVSKRDAVSGHVARLTVARQIGVPAGTLENLRRGRTKGVRAWVAERVRAAVIKELQAEINRLTHDLDVAHSCGLRMDSDEILSASAALAAAKKIIEGAK